VVFTDAGLRAGVRLPDARWLYSLVADPVANRDSSLWEARVTGGSGGLEGRRHLRDWSGAVSLSEFTVSANGTRMVYLKKTAQKDVYIAGLGPDGGPVDPRRLTLDDRDDFVTNWTPDSRALYFTSDRNGTRDIFRQSIDSRVAEAIVYGADEESGPTAVSSDGAWLYYVMTPRGELATWAAGNVVMRTPSSGGAREKLADNARSHAVLCARPPSTVCVFAERNGAELSVDAFDVAHGRGRRIATTSIKPGGQIEISPDGSLVAIQMAAEGRMRVLSLQGDPPRDIDIRARRLDGSLFSWSPDSAGWYLSSTAAEYPTGTDLLHVDLAGHVRVVWHQNVRDWVSAIPAPDGRHIALSQTSTVSNVWMLKGF
jgi:dipeptidyl aminopeptidase/acylaminoacyl peptidase